MKQREGVRRLPLAQSGRKVPPPLRAPSPNPKKERRQSVDSFCKTLLISDLFLPLARRPQTKTAAAPSGTAAA